MRRFVEATMHLGTFAGGRRVLARQGDVLVALDMEDGAEAWRTSLPAVSFESLDPADAVGVILLDQRTGGSVTALGADDGAVRYRLAGAVACVERDVFVLQTADALSLRDASTGTEIVAVPVTRADTVAVSRDHRWLAAAWSDVELWDLTTRTRRRLPGGSSLGLRFREDSAALITHSSQTQQSGNQDWNVECVYDVATGACLDEQGYWDQERPAGPPEHVPPELASQVHWRALVARSPRGEVFVAKTDPHEVEVRVVRR
jgi:hypothetical protein